MFFDIGAGLVMEVDDCLEVDLVNSFVQCDVVSKTKKIIQCKLQNNNIVKITFEDKTYEFLRNNWIAQVFQLLPEIYKREFYNCVILHGSCFCVGNKVVLLLGHSRSGKSTSLYNIIKTEKGRYVSDDVVVINIENKYILPLSNKPIQVRQDVVGDKDVVLLDDAWNMNKLAYIQPKESIKMKGAISLELYEIIYCFIQYNSNEYTYHLLDKFELVNNLIRCCFNLSNNTSRLFGLPRMGKNKALYLKYDGDIKKLLEVIE